MPEKLRHVHERFGPAGVFGIVRDASSAAISAALRDPAIGIDDMFGASLEVCQKSVGAAVAEALDASGIELSAFLLGAAEFGRTGEVIQATLRARHELEREQAEAPTRLARATNDADLQQNLTLSNEDAWRYRETDLWGELIQRTQTLQVAARPPGPGVVGISTTDRAEPAASARRSRPRMHNRERENRAAGRPFAGARRRPPPGHHDDRHRLVWLSSHPMERAER